MKTMKQRVIAILCCVVLLVTSLYIVEPQKAEAATAPSTMSITNTEYGFDYKSSGIAGAGLMNLSYTGVAEDYSAPGPNFLDEAFAEKYITFGGGMTYADLVDGMVSFYVATNNILQFNWENRTTPFTYGWSFTIAKGALLPYVSTSGMSYMALDKEYTFTFVQSNNGYGCEVTIVGCNVTTFSLGNLTLWGNATGSAESNFDFTDSNVSATAYQWKDIWNDETYSDYITVSDVDFKDYETAGIGIRYIVSKEARCIQISSWGTLRDTMTQGDQVIFRKGLPIYYTGSDGNNWKATLDATYVYECYGSNGDNTQIFYGVKLDDSTPEYGLSINATQTTEPQGSEQYIEVSFDYATVKAGVVQARPCSENILTDKIAEEYLQIAGYTVAEALSMGIAIRYIPNVNVIQMGFGTAAVAALEVGDTIVLKEGMPVAYLYNGTLYAAKLDAEYTFTVTANNGTNLTFSRNLSDTYSLTGTVSGPNSESGYTYFGLPITPDEFTDNQSRGEGALDSTVWQPYVYLSKHTTTDLTTDGSCMKWYTYSADVFQGIRLYSNLSFADGEQLIIKKGLPITYNTSEVNYSDGTGVKSKVTYLDKDYGFVYDASTMKFTYDSTLGNEEIQEGPQVFDFNGTDFDTTVDYSTEGKDALREVNVAVLLTDTSAVPKSYTDSVYGGGSEHYASVPVDFGKPIDLSKVTAVKVRMYIPTYSSSTKSEFRLLTNESTSSDVSYATASYVDIGGVFGEWCEVDITDMLKSSSTVKDEEGYLGRFIIAFRTREAVTCYFDYISIEGTDYFVSEDGTFKDVTIEKLGSISAFNTTSSEWDIYPIPNNPSKVPGTEGVTKFDVVYEIGGVEYSGTFTRSDDANGLYLAIPVKNLAADADGVFVTIKAGEYASSGTSAGINITDDYVIYIYNGVPNQYEGDVYCETDSDTYTVSEADTVQIDGETYELGGEYAKSGSHVLTYTVDGCTYAKRLAIYRIGDINDDGNISAIDLVAIKKRIAGKREVSMSGIKASDMDMDDVVTTYDTNLLRKYLVTEQGVLVLSPREGNTVANASDAAEGLIVDYYYEKSELYKTGEDIYHRDITILKWLSFENVETYTVALATTEDMSDRVLYQTTDCSLKLMNLLKNTDYYWTVTAGEFVSPIQTFHTADTIRTITVEGVSNTRDGGGWKTEDGKVVKQGMFYRGGKLDDITASGLTVMNEQLGIKTDMDLRNSSETDGASSPLGSSVQYVNYSGPYYWGTTNGINTDAYREALVNEICTFADEDNYPIYVHCSLGRDRTGTICFLINALLGVSEEDLYLDYEFSMLSVTGTMDNATVHALVADNFGTMYDNVKAYAPNGTMAEATEAFMLSIGVTQDKINMIRQLLLKN